MHSFWSFIGNDKYDIGCTGQTVYLYDKEGGEIAKFKDLIYAYDAAISPRNDIFVVKSGLGIMAVYSFEPPALIKKFRFTKQECGGDGGFSFSPDGSELYSIENRINTLITKISIYDTSDFSLKRSILDTDQSLVLEFIDCEKETNEYYILGYIRPGDPKRADNSYFVGKLKNDKLEDIVYVPYADYSFYFWYLDLRMRGFTKKTYEWSMLTDGLDELKRADLHLSNLWKRFAKDRM